MSIKNFKIITLLQFFFLAKKELGRCERTWDIGQEAEITQPNGGQHKNGSENSKHSSGADIEACHIEMNPREK